MNPDIRSRGFARSRRAVFTMLAALAAISANVIAAPAAHAAGNCSTEEQSYSLKIDRKLQTDNHLSFGASYTYCWSNGEVTSFVVNETFGEDAGVKVDIRPYHPLQWGPTYPIFINGSKSGNISHNSVTLTAG